VRTPTTCEGTFERRIYRLTSEADSRRKRDQSGKKNFRKCLKCRKRRGVGGEGREEDVPTCGRGIAVLVFQYLSKADEKAHQGSIVQRRRGIQGRGKKE